MPLKASSKSYTTRIQFKVDKATYEWLEAASKSNKVTMAAYLRAIVTDAIVDAKPSGIPDKKYLLQRGSSPATISK